MDTNVVAVTFDTLSGPAGVHTGDVMVCNNEECTAVLSHLSKVSEGSHSDKKVHNIKLRLIIHACYYTNVDAELMMTFRFGYVSFVAPKMKWILFLRRFPSLERPPTC